MRYLARSLGCVVSKVVKTICCKENIGECVVIVKPELSVISSESDLKYYIFTWPTSIISCVSVTSSSTQLSWYMVHDHLAGTVIY